jgi:hypothetical protein
LMIISISAVTATGNGTASLMNSSNTLPSTVVPPAYQSWTIQVVSNGVLANAGVLEIGPNGTLVVALGPGFGMFPGTAETGIPNGTSVCYTTELSS